jgi:formate-dependent phosphoribosylglycinamide formyltransferase (GAR transformylase)
MTDGAALRQLVELEKPQLIVPEIEAIATDMLVEIEAAGLAEVIPTARAARLTMNREGIRRLAAEELGLPTSPYQFADSLAELQAAIDAGIGYPCIVKPTMSSSGKGQSLLRGPDDVQKPGIMRRVAAGSIRAGSSSRALSISTTKSPCSPSVPVTPAAMSSHTSANPSATYRFLATTSNRGSRRR